VEWTNDGHQNARLCFEMFLHEAWGKKIRTEVSQSHTRPPSLIFNSRVL